MNSNTRRELLRRKALARAISGVSFGTYFKDASDDKTGVEEMDPELKAIVKDLKDFNALKDTIVKREDLSAMKKDLDDARTQIRVLQSHELEKPGLGMFSGSIEYWATLAKAWKGDEDAKKTMFDEYPRKVNAFLKAPAGFNEGIDSQGGIFVLPEYSSGLMMVPPTLAQIRSYCRVIPMQGNLWKERALVDKNHNTKPFGGITVSRKPEAGTITPSMADWEWIELKPSKVTGMCVITSELLEDAPAFASYLPPLFMAAMENHEQNDWLFGPGAGEPLGGLHANNPALITVAKDTNQTAKTITITNLLNMRARIWGYQNAVWLSSVDNIPQFATMTIGQIPVYTQTVKGDVTFDLILGRPVLYSEHMKTTGTVNDIALVNWSQYLIGQKGGIRQDQSIHVYFTTDQMALRWVTRNDGQPAWREKLTPVSGSNTLSPFVNLAVRA